MNKRTLLLAALLAWSASLRADDVADARKAFDLYVLYSHTADKRTPDLFAPDVSVTNARIYDGKEQDIVIPAKRFFEILKDGIDAKDGDNGTYEDIRCVAENGLVKLTCTCIDGGTGDCEPMVLIYGKGPTGQPKIKAMKTTYPPLK